MAGRRSRTESAHTGDAATLAGAIRGARERRNITQEQLAYTAGLSLSTVRKIESSAVVEPGFFTVMAILAALDLDPPKLRLPETRRRSPQRRRSVHKSP
jgi:transcriptional regulator with XRE-family HTH domain